MPSSNLPPEEQPAVRSFDPLVLDRTMIAIPLLKEMKEDLDLIETVEKTYPEAAQKFNAAIGFNENFPRGVKAARERVLTMAEDAKQAALETSKKRLANTAKELLDVAQKRHDALVEETEKQTIGPLQAKTAYSFAFLHANISTILMFRELAIVDHPLPRHLSERATATKSMQSVLLRLEN